MRLTRHTHTHTHTHHRTRRDTRQRPMMILNTLTQCLDLQGVLYTILNELSDTVLNQLLFLNKHSIREISSQYSDMRTFRTRHARHAHDTRHDTHQRMLGMECVGMEWNAASDGAEKNVSVRTVMAAWRMSTRYQFVPYLNDPEDFIFFDLHKYPLLTSLPHSPKRNSPPCRVCRVVLCVLCCVACGTQACRRIRARRRR